MFGTYTSMFECLQNKELWENKALRIKKYEKKIDRKHSFDKTDQLSFDWDAKEQYQIHNVWKLPQYMEVRW